MEYAEWIVFELEIIVMMENEKNRIERKTEKNRERNTEKQNEA